MLASFYALWRQTTNTALVVLALSHSFPCVTGILHTCKSKSIRVSGPRSGTTEFSLLDSLQLHDLVLNLTKFILQAGIFSLKVLELFVGLSQLTLQHIRSLLMISQVLIHQLLELLYGCLQLNLLALPHLDLQVPLLLHEAHFLSYIFVFLLFLLQKNTLLCVQFI